MKRLGCLLSTLSLFLSGCFSPPISTKDLGGATMAGIAGGLIGTAINNSAASSAIGAASGLAIYGAYKVTEQSKEQREKEAYFQGLREGRLETAKSFWDNKTGANGEFYKGASSNKQNVKEGVNYGAETGEPYRTDITYPGSESGVVQEPIRVRQQLPQSN